MRRFLYIALAALTLGACDSLPDWLGEPESPPLPGKRISVMSLDDTLKVDAGIANVTVRLPRPRLNREWPQDGGYANHAMNHLEAPGGLARLWDADIGEGVTDDSGVLSSPVSGGGRLFALDSVGLRVVRRDVPTPDGRGWRGPDSDKHVDCLLAKVVAPWIDVQDKRTVQIRQELGGVAPRVPNGENR